MKRLLFLASILVLGFLVFFLFQSRIASVLRPRTTNTTPLITQLKNKTTDIPPVTIIAENLETPWGIAFLPDENLLITERAGSVKLIDINNNYKVTEIGKIKQSRETGEGGLLGIAIHPDFHRNKYVYFYYTFGQNGANTLNRVSRFTFEKNILKNEQVIVDRIPGASNHNGGRIKFGPDKNLYITSGDAQEPSLAQDTRSLAGKILRVTDEGKPTGGNPFANSVYSYGHRNPQGITWDKKGNLWQTEHGRSAPTGFDEINLIQSGKNYGWPEIQGDETRDSMITPIKNSGPTTVWAPGGAAFFKNSLYFAGLRGQTLYQAVIKNNQIVSFKEHLKGKYGRLRDVIVGPDKMLYVTTSNLDGRGNPQADGDQIIRINPNKL